MRKKHIVFTLAIIIAFLVSCTKYEKINHSKEDVTDIFSTAQTLVGVGQTTTFGVSFKSDSYTWYVDGEKKATSSKYDYTPTTKGIHTLKVDISAGSYTCEVYVGRPVTSSSSKWISSVKQYHPSPGQNINDEEWGTQQNAQTIIGNGNGGVSLGGFGGYIVFEFDHTVVNGEGYDFVIKGNAYKGGSEPGCVMVAFDANANGQADPDEWYELSGENHSKTSTVKNYVVTYTRPQDLLKAADILWTDNKEGNGKLDAKVLAPFHPQSYWPSFISSESHLTYIGTRLVGLLEDRSTPTEELWYRASAGKGYADNYSAEYPDVVNLDNDTAGSNKFDVTWARDENGKEVKLPGIDFIKVYTCVNDFAGWLGEGSTEVCGAISLSVKNKK